VDMVSFNYLTKVLKNWNFLNPGYL
jgi:hypothetical protein